MAAVKDMIAQAQAAQHADLVKLLGLIEQLVKAFANGTMSAADAQVIVDAMAADDASVKTTSDAVQGVLDNAGGTPVQPTP